MKFIKRIFGYCNRCERWFVYPKRRRMSTMYENENSNYTYCCKECFDEIEEYGQERWDDFYSSRL